MQAREAVILSPVNMNDHAHRFVGLKMIATKQFNRQAARDLGKECCCLVKFEAYVWLVSFLAGIWQETTPMTP